MTQTTRPSIRAAFFIAQRLLDCVAHAEAAADIREIHKDEARARTYANAGRCLMHIAPALDQACEGEPPAETGELLTAEADNKAFWDNFERQINQAEERIARRKAAAGESGGAEDAPLEAARAEDVAMSP